MDGDDPVGYLGTTRRLSTVTTRTGRPTTLGFSEVRGVSLCQGGNVRKHSVTHRGSEIE